MPCILPVGCIVQAMKAIAMFAVFAANLAIINDICIAVYNIHAHNNYTVVYFIFNTV